SFLIFLKKTTKKLGAPSFWDSPQPSTDHFAESNFILNCGMLPNEALSGKETSDDLLFPS
ncbi:hypothetical protein ACFO25_19940, partial [Paenactinomyces guangxiensis]